MKQPQEVKTTIFWCTKITSKRNQDNQYSMYKIFYSVKTSLVARMQMNNY